MEGTDDIYDLTPAPGTVTEEGTFLNVENLLKDTTAALLGGDANMVPDEAFVILKNLSDGLKNSAVQLAFGSYAGTGTYGKSNPTSLSFGFIPKMLIVVDDPDSAPVFVYVGQPGATDIRNGGLLFTLNDKTLSWYTVSTLNGAAGQANASDTTYYYITIGFLEGAA